jgi:hypothetical protein
MLCYLCWTPLNKKVGKVMAKTVIKITYDNGDCDTLQYDFDTLKDAEVYARLYRMKKVAWELKIANRPLHKGSKVYRQLLDSGKIKKSESIIKSEANKLLEELKLF